MSVTISRLAGLYEKGKGPEAFAALGRVFTPLDRPLPDLYRWLAENPERLNDLESDLSLAYYDPGEDCLTLIRDACGATPLFAAQKGEAWAFGLTLADLFGVLGRRPEINEETFYDFLASHYRYVFRDPRRTFHRGVSQIPAGCYARITPQGMTVKPWLRLTFDPLAQKMDLEAAGRTYLEMLAENTSFRLKALAGEKYAFTVSSGMDSSTVAALASRETGPLETWFMAYKEQSQSPYDESEGVQKLLAAFPEWHLNRLDLGAPDLLRETEELLAKTSAPVITVTWLAHYVLAKAARDTGAAFLFSGLGGDESLAGEFEHFFLFFADLVRSGQTELLEEETKAWAELHDHPVFKKSPAVRDEWLAKNIDFQTGEIRVDQVRLTQNRKFFDPGWIEAMEKIIPPIPMPRPYPFFLSNRLYQEMTYETSPPTMWSEALSSRAGGIKGLFPMASPRLFRLALSLPGTFKYRRGVTKWFLREAVRDLLPQSTAGNPVKTGFNAPLDLWLREPALAKKVLELLADGPLRQKYWLKKGAAEELITAHLKGQASHMMVLWPLIVTSIFLNLS
ncbi:MAG: hypothetical protein LBK52_06020 [Deltaproteobacteria bacterium]|jgi:asparagine synthase (glutamine-hydrolysing)|nr:hypothetical protein [Deltaproteobacteria bacterium]